MTASKPRGFNLDRDIAYLNHAAVSPWPVCTADAVKAFAEENARQGSKNYPAWVAVEGKVRQQLAGLSNAKSPDEIAMLKNTSEALSVVAWGLDWQAGDNVVITDQEFPSNRIVWESLKDLGVETRPAALDKAGTPEEAITGCIDDRTRLVSVSAVQYATGLRLDLERIGEHCKKKGVLFCVDAIQAIGALPFDVQACQADFVMADAHKWMMGPEGIALFYCNANSMDKLSLRQFGWHMVENPGDYDNPEWEVASTARRFECGSPNMTGIHALHASLQLIHDNGMETISTAVLDNSRYLFDRLAAVSDRYSIVTPQEQGRFAGIVSFRPRGEDLQSLYGRLTDNNVVCALRGGAIRFSPHFHTPREHLDRALALL